MLYMAKFTVCPKIHTRSTNTNRQKVKFLMLKLAVHKANDRILAEIIFKDWLDFCSELRGRGQQLFQESGSSTCRGTAAV